MLSSKASNSFVPVCSFLISWHGFEAVKRRTIFSMCLTLGVSPSSLSAGARRSPQAFLWPPLPPCLTACQCVSKTHSSTQWLGVSKDNSANLDSLGVCVCVEFCGEGSSAFLSRWYTVGLALEFFTVDHTWPRIGWECSCSGRSLSAARPLAAAVPRFPAPGRRRARWSGSPSAAVRHGNVSLPHCSSFSGTSISHPEEKWRKKKLVNKKQEGGHYHSPPS